MNLLRFLTVFLIMFLVTGTHPVWSEGYRLGSGDVLAITVWGYDDLQVKDIAVRPDGRIAFPLVGELEVQGRSAGEVTADLTGSLKQYIINPQVSVNIAKYRTTRVYVLGEVAKPGVYELDKHAALLDALGMAGGYTKYAAKKEVVIIRNRAGDKPVTINLLHLLEKGDLSQNYALQEGDVVYLTNNGTINFASDILPWISGVYQVSTLRD